MKPSIVLSTVTLKEQRTLKPFLRQGKRLRRKRYASNAKPSLMPHKVSISLRPRTVDQKRRVDDWECDTVIGKDRKSALVTVVERKTLFTVCAKVTRKNAASVACAMITLLTPYKEKVKILTFDNGVEHLVFPSNIRLTMSPYTLSKLYKLRNL